MERHEGASIGLLRAILSGGLIVVVTIAVLVYVPNLVLTRLTGLSRSGRVAIATSWFFVVLVVLGWTLRRLQARRMV